MARLLLQWAGVSFTLRVAQGMGECVVYSEGFRVNGKAAGKTRGPRSKREGVRVSVRASGKTRGREGFSESFRENEKALFGPSRGKLMRRVAQVAYSQAVLS
jgi:hypothetical protein